jgi:hypothetical protein
MFFLQSDLDRLSWEGQGHRSSPPSRPWHHWQATVEIGFRKSDRGVTPCPLGREQLKGIYNLAARILLTQSGSWPTGVSAKVNQNDEAGTHRYLYCIDDRRHDL